MSFNRTDLILRFLKTIPSLSPDLLSTLTDWWKSEAGSDEDLAAFLHHRSILSQTALQQLEMVQKGYFTIENGADLLSSEEIRALETALCERESTRSSECEDDLAISFSHPISSPSAPEPFPDQVERPSDPERRDREVEDRSTDQPEPSIGDVLGRCLLTEELGRGGFSTVYRALHQSLNISVALKVLSKRALEREHYMRDRLQEEARLMAQLNHPHLVRLWDFDCQGPIPFLVMELVEGLNLAELINQSGHLQLDRAVRIIEQAVLGLGAAWDVGVVHRDVKPHNILLTKTSTVKVADLGVALRIGTEEAGTRIVGTVAYVSPEQATSSGTVDFRSDIYSLGATFYHCVTGKLPFQARSHQEMLLKHLHEDPVAAHEVNPLLSQEVSAFIGTCMAKDPQDRFQSQVEVLESARLLLNDSPPVQQPPAGGTGASSDKKTKSVWRSLFGGK